MTQATKSRKSTKTVQIIARFESKADSRKVQYLVRSSNGVDLYYVSLFDGAVTGCGCPSHGRCYHIRGVQIAELNREARQVPTPAAATPDEVAAQAEVQAEAKMQAFKAGLEAQYASDPRVESAREEQETRDSYMRAFYAEY